VELYIHSSICLHILHRDFTFVCSPAVLPCSVHIWNWTANDQLAQRGHMLRSCSILYVSYLLRYFKKCVRIFLSSVYCECKILVRFAINRIKHMGPLCMGVSSISVVLWIFYTGQIVSVSSQISMKVCTGCLH
jgi:hypothetical protein